MWLARIVRVSAPKRSETDTTKLRPSQPKRSRTCACAPSDTGVRRSSVAYLA